MFDRGIIVSIQGYTKEAAEELAFFAIEGGAVAIRTDQPIKCEKTLIGLEKIMDMEYYITTTKEAIDHVHEWTNLIAIDSRRGNPDLEVLYSYCHMENINIVADIQDAKDAENILKMCEKKKLVKPRFFATTFSLFSMQKIMPDVKAIWDTTNMSDIPVIAEGGYSDYKQVMTAQALGAYAICIGSEISDIRYLTEKYRSYLLC